MPKKGKGYWVDRIAAAAAQSIPAAPAQAESTPASLFSNFSWLVDDFTVGLTQSGLIGELGWVSPQGTLTVADSVPRYPGTLMINTGTQSLNVSPIAYGTQRFFSLQAFVMTWILRLHTRTADPKLVRLRAGLMNTQLGEPTAGIYFESDSQDNNPGTWAGVNTGGSGNVRTLGNKTLTLGDWHRYDIVYEGGTAPITFSIDGTSYVSFQATPSTLAVQPVLQLANREPMEKVVEIDYFSLQSAR